MAAMGQPDHLSTNPHLNGIPRLPSTQGTPHPAALSNAWASDHRERFMMEMHTPYGRPYTNGSPSYHESMESSSVWQLPRSASDMHLQGADSAIRVSSGTMMDNERAPDSLNRGSPASLQRSSSSEMYDSAVVSGDWRQFVDTGLRYSAMPPPSSSPLPPNTSHAGGARGLNEGAMIRELIGRMGGNGISTHGVTPLVSSPQQQRSGAAIEKTLKLGNAWNSISEGPSNAALISVDPSKGGLSLNGVGLSTSHCLAHFPSDPGFAERAARFSSFGSGNYGQPFPDPAKLRSRSSAALLGESTAKQLTRTSSCPPLRDTGVVTSPDHSSTSLDDLPDEKNGDTEEGKLSVKVLSRSASNLVPVEDEQQVGTTCVEDLPAGIQVMSTPDQASGEICPSGATSVIDISANKRKGGPEEKVIDLGPDMPASSHGERDVKTPESEDAKVKRLRRGESFKGKEESKARAERSGSETSGETSPRSIKDQSKPSEPPKPDYIHVRARRGQATDSHSLAERVRREKISERMKFLQDLVPGCSKVTGKAVMLDEIINYVQSLQRQVEFLSMKLASVNPRGDFNLESFLSKEVTSHPGSQTMVLGPETSVPYHQMHSQHQTQIQHCLPVGLDYPLNLPTEVTLTRSVNVPPIPASIPGVDGFGECQQLQTQWDDGELQSVVQMSFGNAQSMPPQALHCHVPPGQVKVELQQPPISCL